MGSLLQERVRVVATFDAFLVINSAKAFNNAVDMSKVDVASFMFGADDTYTTSDADLTIQLYEVATDVVTGGVSLGSAKALTLAPGTTVVKQGVVDVKASELTSGKRYVYAEILGDDATQTALVWGVAIAGDLRYGLGNENAVTGTTFAV